MQQRIQPQMVQPQMVQQQQQVVMRGQQIMQPQQRGQLPAQQVQRGQLVPPVQVVNQMIPGQQMPGQSQQMQSQQMAAAQILQQQMQLNPQQRKLLKQEQLRSFKQHVPRATQVDPKNENEWFLKLVNPKSQIITNIIVSFPKDFPQMKPGVLVSPICDHPWIDRNTGYISGHPQLRTDQWQPVFDMGRIINEILHEFNLRAPIPLARLGNDQIAVMSANVQGVVIGNAQASQSAAPATTPSQGATPTAAVVPQPGSGNQPLQEWHPDYIPDRFEELSNLPMETLEYLEWSLNFNSTGNEFGELLHEFDILQQKKTILVDLMESNAKTAQETLKNEPQIQKLREELQDKYKVVVEKRDAVQKVLEQQKEIIKKASNIDSLQDMLRVKIDLALQASEDAQQAEIKRLEEGGKKIKIKNYLASRKAYHRLVAKSEKLKDDAT